MEYLVHMEINIPESVSDETLQEIVLKERKYTQDLQKEGKWVHIWRVVGEYANYSIFDVENHDELRQILSNQPLYKWMKLKVTPLAYHPG